MRYWQRTDRGCSVRSSRRNAVEALGGASTRDDFPALRCTARTLHSLARITVDYRVVDGQLDARRNAAHRHERDLAPNTDVRIAGMVEAKNTRFDLLGHSRRDVE